MFVVFSAIWIWNLIRQQRDLHEAATLRAEELERRIALMASRGPSPFWIGKWDAARATLNIEFANEAYAHCWSLEHGEGTMTGRAFFRGIDLADRERVESRFLELIGDSNQTAADLECRVTRSGSASTWMSLRFEVERGSDGQLGDIWCVARDIGQWKQTDRELQDSEYLFHSLFDQSHDAIALCSIDGTFIDANAAFLDLSGYSWSELSPLRYQSLTAEEDQAAEDLIFREQVWSRGFSEVYEKRSVCQDGRVVSISARVCALKVEDGESPGFFAIARNIEAEKRQRDELTRSKVLAEKASEAKNRFLTVVSQELRTPLNPVIGYADLLLSRDLGEMERGFIEIIRDSALHMSRLTSDIIEFARIESGEAAIEETPFRIPELLDSVARQMESSAKALGNALECKYTWKVSAVTGDKERIRKVLTNLVSHATRFTKDGHITLSCGLLSGSGDEAVFRFTVSDDGMGIPESLLGEVFDPFAHANQEYGFDAGLGLAISRQLVQSMGGSIALESKVGAGTTFFVDLPLPVVLQRDTDLAGANGLSSRGADFRVLLVEDDRANRNYASDLLATLGCEVKTACDGEESLVMLGKERFDLVLMDLGLPHLDGFETASKVRKGDGPNRDVPIVALTARVSEATRMRCRSLGINDFLAKPVTCSVFEDVLHRWLDRD